MLHPYYTFYRTNAAFHLGDLVNIYQQCAALSDTTLYSETICPCCQNSAADVFKFLTGLNPAVKFGKLGGKPIEMNPWWFKDWQGQKTDYIKALQLPSKGSHIAVQIDSRSKGQKIPIWASRAVKLLNKAINVGDRPLKCKNKNKVDLATKFEIIASARYYVGIDSGLTHLALMTNTPIILIHPPEWDVSRFYPDTPQIVKVSNYKDFVKVIENA